MPHLGVTDASVENTVQDDATAHCLSGNSFCERTREFKLDVLRNSGSEISYSLLKDSLVVNDDTASINGKL